MQHWSLPFVPVIPKLTFTSAIDILVVAILIYQCLSIIRGRRAAHILGGIGVLILVYLLAVWLRLELLRSILAKLAGYTPIALIVMFQSELRRLLARLGRSRWSGFGGQVKSHESADEILLAVTQLSEQKVGALIVLERDIGLRTFIESGVSLDATLSRDLLLAIFQPGGALHDGAVVVQGDRIAAAACFLPLTMNPTLAGKCGTRHRAGIGVTEETDCLAVIVSEETGQISAAASGIIERNMTVARLAERIALHFGRRKPRKIAPPGSGAQNRLEPDTESWRQPERG